MHHFTYSLLYNTFTNVSRFFRTRILVSFTFCSAGLPRRHPRGSEHGYKSLIPASRMAFFTARCIRDSSTCQRPSWPVNSFFQRFFCGKSHCHLSSLLPEGYFESRALGCDTGFAFLFWTEALLFSKKEDCLKKTTLSDYSLRILIDRLEPYMCYVISGYITFMRVIIYLVQIE